MPYSFMSSSQQLVFAELLHKFVLSEETDNGQKSDEYGYYYSLLQFPTKPF